MVSCILGLALLDNFLLNFLILRMFGVENFVFLLIECNALLLIFVVLELPGVSCCPPFLLYMKKPGPI